MCGCVGVCVCVCVSVCVLVRVCVSPQTIISQEGLIFFSTQLRSISPFIYNPVLFLLLQFFDFQNYIFYNLKLISFIYHEFTL